MFTVKVEGIDDLKKQLQAIAPLLAAKPMRDALNAVGQDFEDEAKTQAPVHPGNGAKLDKRAQPGALRDSIGHAVRVSPSKGKGYVKIGPTLDGGPVGKHKTTNPGIYGLFIELGFKSYAANPFLRRTFDAVKGFAVDKFLEVFRGSMNQVLRGKNIRRS